MTVPSLQTNTFSNSKAPDETARKDQSHQDLHCHSVIDFGLKHLFATMDVSKFRDGRIHFINSGVKVAVSGDWNSMVVLSIPMLSAVD